MLSRPPCGFDVIATFGAVVNDFGSGSSARRTIASEPASQSSVTFDRRGWTFVFCDSSEIIAATLHFAFSASRSDDDAMPSDFGADRTLVRASARMRVVGLAW